MNDERRSGNRWEPTDPGTTAPIDGAPSSTAPGDTATAEFERPTEPADDQLTVLAGYAAPTEPAGAGSWRDRLRPLRTKSAAIAAATFLVGGAGGFALGHALAGNGDQTGQPGQQGRFTPGQRPDGFSRGDGDGGGFGGGGVDGDPQQGQQNGQQAPNQNGAQQGTTSGSTT